MQTFSRRSTWCPLYHPGGSCDQEESRLIAIAYTNAESAVLCSGDMSTLSSLMLQLLLRVDRGEDRLLREEVPLV